MLPFLARYIRLSALKSLTVSTFHQYRTGKTLGSGTYAIVKEAIHIQTGEYFACKVINKKLMEGREHMVLDLVLYLRAILLTIAAGPERDRCLETDFQRTQKHRNPPRLL